jgi:alpha-methylacyl-CoA racemase
MNHRSPANGPLLGIRILDLTRLLPGPLGTMLMADMGADVIKIENPESPDYVRVFPPHLNGESVNYLSFNRSKRSLALNYNTPEGRETFFDLLKTADVVMEQFRPGFLDKIGIGYEAAKAVNPQIIYVSVTGYGQTGPYAHLAGHDLNYIGYAGVLGMTGASPADVPAVPGVQLADIAGGSYMSVIGTLAALQARNRTGEGQHVDVSMTDGVMPLLSAVYALHAGGQDVQRGLAPLSGGMPNYGVYVCQDQKYVVLGTLEAKFWNKFCALVQQPDWLGFMLPKNPTELADFKAKIGAIFSTQPQQYWVELGLKNDLLISPVYQLADLEHDPHLQARQMIITQEHARAGSFKTIGVPLKFSKTPASPAWPAPTMGEDTEAILAEIKQTKA